MLLLADQPGEVAERLEVGDARQQHPRAVAVDDRLGLLPVAAAGLREVVEDRDELDVVARRGRRDLREVRERRDVARLVEADEQRQREPPALLVGELVGAVDHL